MTGYSFDQCWQDYRTATLFLFTYSVLTAGSAINTANERGVTLFSTIGSPATDALGHRRLKAYEMPTREWVCCLGSVHRADEQITNLTA